MSSERYRLGKRVAPLPLHTGVLVGQGAMLGRSWEGYQRGVNRLHFVHVTIFSSKDVAGGGAHAAFVVLMLTFLNVICHV